MSSIQCLKTGVHILPKGKLYKSIYIPYHSIRFIKLYESYVSIDYGLAYYNSETTNNAEKMYETLLKHMECTTTTDSSWYQPVADCMMELK